MRQDIITIILLALGLVVEPTHMVVTRTAVLVDKVPRLLHLPSPAMVLPR